MRMQVRPLTSLSRLRIWHCLEVWCRLAATALFQPLAWELPCVMGVATHTKKKKNKEKKRGKKEKTDPAELKTH